MVLLLLLLLLLLNLEDLKASYRWLTVGLDDSMIV